MKRKSGLTKKEKRYIPQKITKSQLQWLEGKTISSAKVVRPTKEERAMYEVMLGPMALKVFFTDGSYIILDTWIGDFLLKKSSISDVQNKRQRSYFTIRRKEVTKE